jgi:hypothetical protein
LSKNILRTIQYISEYSSEFNDIGIELSPFRKVISLSLKLKCAFRHWTLFDQTSSLGSILIECIGQNMTLFIGTSIYVDLVGLCADSIAVTNTKLDNCVGRCNARIGCKISNIQQLPMSEKKDVVLY